MMEIPLSITCRSLVYAYSFEVICPPGMPCCKIYLQINGKRFSYPLTIIVEEQWRRTQRQTRKRKGRHPPPISRLLKQLCRKEWHNTSHDGPEDGPSRDRGSRVFLERVNVVVLGGVEYGDLAEPKEDGAEDRDGPMDVVFDGPREPEE